MKLEITTKKFSARFVQTVCLNESMFCTIFSGVLTAIFLVVYNKAVFPFSRGAERILHIFHVGRIFSSGMGNSIGSAWSSISCFENSAFKICAGFSVHVLAAFMFGGDTCDFIFYIKYVHQLSKRTMRDSCRGAKKYVVP